MRKKKVAILKNEDAFDHLGWVAACMLHPDDLEFEIIEITRYDWLDQIKRFNPDLCLLKPSGRTELYRTLYQERTDILVNELELMTIPSYQELRIYENKKFFAYWAAVNNLPHPQTWVFYCRHEALRAVKSMGFPIVGKKSIGASGNGVRIIYDIRGLEKYISAAFSSGIGSRTGPKFNKGKLFSRFWDKLIHPKQLRNRLNAYKMIASDKQKGFVILQEYILHEFEWRAVRIGDSYFAHKKLKTGEKASGTLLKSYENPPLDLLDYVRQITERFGFFSVAIDLFETSGSEYLINEIQCIFGQSDSYQMMVDGIIGRYIWREGSWVFEAGDFAVNGCYNLRLDWVLSKRDEPRLP
ncbi:MAG: hypothetical protein Q8M98_11675 [Candidatus Cloacimonadaceae bacterium]|nr:hypothetical protein [Candidatus Cloacimonadaceae bacterium]